MTRRMICELCGKRLAVRSVCIGESRYRLVCGPCAALVYESEHEHDDG